MGGGGVKACALRYLPLLAETPSSSRSNPKEAMMRSLWVMLVAGLLAGCDMEEPVSDGLFSVRPNSDEVEVPDGVTVRDVDLNRDKIIDVRDLVIVSKFMGQEVPDEVDDSEQQACIDAEHADWGRPPTGWTPPEGGWTYWDWGGRSDNEGNPRCGCRGHKMDKEIAVDSIYTIAGKRKWIYDPYNNIGVCVDVECPAKIPDGSYGGIQNKGYTGEYATEACKTNPETEIVCGHFTWKSGPQLGRPGNYLGGGPSAICLCKDLTKRPTFRSDGDWACQDIG